MVSLSLIEFSRSFRTISPACDVLVSLVRVVHYSNMSLVNLEFPSMLTKRILSIRFFIFYTCTVLSFLIIVYFFLVCYFTFLAVFFFSIFCPINLVAYDRFPCVAKFSGHVSLFNALYFTFHKSAVTVFFVKSAKTEQKMKLRGKLC